ncbi:unnamed protein product [Caenorhabditis brenneri]
MMFNGLQGGRMCGRPILQEQMTQSPQIPQEMMPIQNLILSHLFARLEYIFNQNQSTHSIHQIPSFCYSQQTAPMINQNDKVANEHFSLMDMSGQSFQ